MSGTVLVTGAGASQPYGLPLGVKLKHEVARLTNLKPETPTDHMASALLKKLELGESRNKIEGTYFSPLNVTRIFKENSFDLEKVIDFGQRLSGSYLYSVDYFLEINPDFSDVGKILIYLALIKRERRNTLYRANSDDWYKFFNNQVVRRIQDLNSGEYYIVTFNYDRSFQHYFINAISSTLGINRRDACELLLEKIPIIHLHGRLGPLPEENDESGFKYGDLVFSPLEVYERAQNIMVLDKEVQTTESFDRARELILNSERTLFVGFGYHQLSLDRLLPNTGDGSPIWGSAVGKTSGEIENIQKNNVAIRELVPCHGSLEFLKSYLWKS